MDKTFQIRYAFGRGSNKPIPMRTGIRITALACALLMAGTLMPAPASSDSKYFVVMQYRDPKARRVSIKADFTGWKRVPMKKMLNGVWAHSAKLGPGEYLYNFVVDGATIRDPLNQQAKQYGDNFSSVIVIRQFAKQLPARKSSRR